MDYNSITAESLTAMEPEALTAALTEAKDEAQKFAAKDSVTVEEVDTFEQVLAAVGLIEAEVERRAQVAKDAADRFAAAKAKFSADTEEPEEPEAEEPEEPEQPEEPEAEQPEEPEAEQPEGEQPEGEQGEALSASGDAAKRTVVKASGGIGKKVAKRVPAPGKATPQVVITAAADVPDFATGQRLTDMEQVTKAAMNRVEGFSPFDEAVGRANYEASHGEPMLTKVGVASFRSQFDKDKITSHGNEYSPVKAALADHERGLVESMKTGQTLTAAGFCAPSETIYSFLADYVVDGLLTLPEVNAPRGGINITTGPSHSTQGQALTDFGFEQTEAEAIAGKVKTCETIECPEFVDHRLEAVGYCFKIPFLTQMAYPELITDALRLADVRYAHKVNKRMIDDVVALSTAVTANGVGASVTDTLEALNIIAMRERRKWNLGRNAIMEVKLPEVALEIFRADMSRRTGLALTDTANEAKINAQFAANRLAVEYVSDWQELPGTGAPVLPDTFDALIYPAGTFVKAVQDVVKLQAVYDAASLSVNEYTGVFFEQAMLVAKVGYGSTKVTIPVCSAGLTGAAILSCEPVTP